MLSSTLRVSKKLGHKSACFSMLDMLNFIATMLAGGTTDNGFIVSIFRTPFRFTT